MKIAVLCGGRSSEHDVSLRSGEAVARGLKEADHEALRVTISRQGTWSCDGETVELIPGEGLLGADVAFPALHGPFGEDGSVQGLLEWLDLPYVGSDVLASAACMDKLTLKRLFAQAGIPQVEFVDASEPNWRERCAQLGSPLWVKPSRLGSSVGISRVAGVGSELDEAVELARRHDPRVIVEAAASGREVECSLLGNEEVDASQPGEVIAKGDWYDYENKYREGGMELVVPPPIPPDQVAQVRELAVTAFKLGGCAGLARCDFFVQPDGTVLVNEINTMPGFTQTSVYAKLWQASGLDYPSLCERLIALAVERYQRARSYEF
ncbi:MAG: D-alanine-D-alanine ligase [Solirubrobacterales bacterium]|jgi:D-alanine-D-alanine ligase|nr:D-alanine-D-alanine ligase [Solirubrobacterales bacterium]